MPDSGFNLCSDTDTCDGLHMARQPIMHAMFLASVRVCVATPPGRAEGGQP